MTARADRARREAMRRRGAIPDRVCADCGRPAISNRHSYCAWCQEHGDGAAMRKASARARKGQREAGRYGTEHRRLRDEWVPRVAAGGVMCARPGCGKPIHPGEKWHLGHVDGSHTMYWGPEHEACNTATETHAKQRREEEARRDRAERLRGS